MRRLTISVHACTETLGLLVAMAWADGRLDDAEKAGVRGAAEVLNLGKAERERLDELLAGKPSLDNAKLDRLSPRDRAFAFVAAAWMAHVDEKLDPEEEKMLSKIGGLLKLDEARQKELIGVAKGLEPLHEGERAFSQELPRLFKAIPPELEPEEEIDDEFEVVFE